MSEYDNTNTGAIFVNDKGDNDKRPDRKGKLNVAGVEYYISGWLRKTKDGQPFLSLKVEPVQKQAAPPQTAHNQAKSNGYAPDRDGDDAGDEIPF